MAGMTVKLSYLPVNAPLAVDPALLARHETALLNWIQELSKQTVTNGFVIGLKDGVVLCKLVNAVRPDTITKINEYASKFRQAENLNAFNMAARFLGVAATEAFQPTDLQDERNVPKVVLCLHSLADHLEGQGVKFAPLPKDGLEELRAAAAALDQANASTQKKNYSTLFEAKQAESQALYKNAHKGTIVKSDTAPSNTGLTFHEAQQAKAQKNASSATNFGGRAIVQAGAGQGAQSVLSYSDSKNAETQKALSGIHRPNSIVKSQDRPVGNTLSFAEAKQAEAQKAYSFGNVNRNVQSNEKSVAGGGLSFAEASMAEAQKRATTKVNNIVRSEEAGAQDVLPMADARAAESQKIISANKTASHSIARVGDEGAGSPSTLSLSDARASEAQKLTSSALQSGHNIVRLDGHAIPAGQP